MDIKNLILLVISIICIMLSACDKKDTTTGASASHGWRSGRIGKYVYQDDNDIIHANPRCIRLMHGVDEDGHKIYGKHPIDTADFVISDERYFRVCAQCVNDRVYEKLIAISHRNSHSNNDNEYYTNNIYEEVDN